VVAWVVIAAVSIGWNIWNELPWLVTLSVHDLTNLLIGTVADVVFTPIVLLAIGVLLGGALIALATAADYVLLRVGWARLKNGAAR
jgi:hypothetical protein